MKKNIISSFFSYKNGYSIYLFVLIFCVSSCLQQNRLAVQERYKYNEGLYQIKINTLKEEYNSLLTKYRRLKSSQILQVQSNASDISTNKNVYASPNKKTQEQQIDKNQLPKKEIQPPTETNMLTNEEASNLKKIFGENNLYVFEQLVKSNFKITKFTKNKISLLAEDDKIFENFDLTNLPKEALLSLKSFLDGKNEDWQVIISKNTTQKQTESKKKAKIIQNIMFDNNFPAFLSGNTHNDNAYTGKDMLYLDFSTKYAKSR